MKNIIILLLLITVNASAQNFVNGDNAPANKFSLDVLAPLNFNYASTLDLFQQKVIPNAIQLNLKVKQESVGIFGHVSFHQNSSAFANKLALKMKYTDSPNANSPLGDVFLSSNPTLLVSQPGGFNSVKHFKYLFDLKLNPPETFEGLNNQSFSVIYTISLL